MPEKEKRIICRCEEIAEQDIRNAVREGYTTIKGIKRRTRAGMGLCQGRTCASLIRDIISEMTGIPKGQIEEDTPRFPAFSVKLADLARDFDRNEVIPDNVTGR